MLADEVPFFGVEWTGFCQDCVGDADLADVVERGGSGEFVDLLGVHTHPTADRGGEAGDAGGVVLQSVLLGTEDVDEHVVCLFSRAGRSTVLVCVHPLVGELQCVVGGRRFVGHQDAAAGRRDRECLATLLEGAAAAATLR